MADPSPAGPETTDMSLPSTVIGDIIPVRLGLMEYEKELIRHIFQIISLYPGFPPEEKQKEITEDKWTVFSDWTWYDRFSESVSSLIDPKGWLYYADTDNDGAVTGKMSSRSDSEGAWDFFLSILRSPSNKMVVNITRIDKLLDDNPELEKKLMWLMSITDTTERPSMVPVPSNDPEEVALWGMVAILQCMVETLRKGALLESPGPILHANPIDVLAHERRQIQLAPTLDQEQGFDTVNFLDDIVDLSWLEPDLESTSARTKEPVRSFEVWSLVRKSAVLLRRESGHLRLLAEALTHCGFGELYVTSGGFYIGTDYIRKVATNTFVPELEFDSYEGPFQDPLQFLEFIPWSDLRLAPSGEEQLPQKLLWKKEGVKIANHLLFTEEDVFSYFADHLELVHNLVEEDSILFVASSLKQSGFVQDLSLYWRKWNDCAITQRPSDGEWLLLETCSGMNYRNEWKTYGEDVAQDSMRRLVDCHRSVSLSLPIIFKDTPIDLNLLRGMDAIPFDQFDDKQMVQVGKGFWGSVYKTVWHCPPKVGRSGRQDRFVALKRTQATDEKAQAYFLREIAISQSVLGKHTNNCIKLYGVTRAPKATSLIVKKEIEPGLWCDDSVEASDVLFLVAEYASAGTLEQFLKAQLTGDESDWKDIVGFMADVAGGLEDLHHKNVVHRDLHIGNVLVRERMLPLVPNEPRYDVVITDLGESGRVPQDPQAPPRQSSYGYRTYRAPEIAKNGVYSDASDMFALGCLLIGVIKIKAEIDSRQHNSVSTVPAVIIDLALTCLSPAAKDRDSKTVMQEIVQIQEDGAQHRIYVTAESIQRKYEGVMALKQERVTESQLEAYQKICDDIATIMLRISIP